VFWDSGFKADLCLCNVCVIKAEGRVADFTFGKYCGHKYIGRVVSADTAETKLQHRGLLNVTWKACLIASEGTLAGIAQSV
jgi:hypothetical protein